MRTLLLRYFAMIEVQENMGKLKQNSGMLLYYISIVQCA